MNSEAAGQPFFLRVDRLRVKLKNDENLFPVWERVCSLDYSAAADIFAIGGCATRKDSPPVLRIYLIVPVDDEMSMFRIDAVITELCDTFHRFDRLDKPVRPAVRNAKLRNSARSVPCTPSTSRAKWCRPSPFRPTIILMQSSRIRP